jgi:electron transfer flavoprotein beta subunit
MRAKKTNIPVWNANDIDVDQTKVGLKGSATQVIKIFNPPKKTDKKILQGDVNKIVEELIDELKSQKII